MNKEYIEHEAVTDLVRIYVVANTDQPPECSLLYHLVKNLAPADVKPVVRGRWYDEDCFDAHGSPIYRCSVCNKTVADNYISAHKYCLHCGAEMLEGDLK